MLAVQDQSLVYGGGSYLLSSDGSAREELDDCGVDSGSAEPLLSGEGRALLLLGCSNTDGYGEFVTKAFVNSRTVTTDIDVSHATWIDQERVLFADERGILRIVNFSNEKPSAFVIGDLGRPVKAIDFDAGESRLAILQSNDDKAASSTIKLVDLKGKVLKEINISENVSTIFWHGNSWIEAEVQHEWLTVDVGSGKVANRRDRRGCSMVAATADSYVSWCPQNGELVQHRDGGTKKKITTIPGDNLDNYFISVAEAVLGRS
ncbi:hypothetical protein [Nonomuraea roseola]|uniref:WD40 repeat domain-containing protein n=1 Tax=Nonomuraea roseola TaxID=46179 RepID=A0ABV5PSI8_9ACTN